MQTETSDLPSPVNHIFVDYENVREVDPAIIGRRTVHLTLLLGAQKTKLDAALVEKLLHHAATVELIRLTSPGRNALDFTLAYYLGRAVLADPCGHFHIVSKDKGYDALIEHLRSRHIFARRHEDFTTLTFSATAKPSTATSPVVTLAAKSSPKLKAPASLEALEARVLEHLRKLTSNRPRTKNKLASFLIVHLGNKITEAEALALIETLRQAGHLVIDDNGKVTYHLGQA